MAATTLRATTGSSMPTTGRTNGNKSTFGDISVAATVPNPDTVSAFAAERSADGALTVVVISKYLSGNTPTTINLANSASNGTAQVWQLTAANTINRLADVNFSGNSFNVTLPPQSITLFVIPAATGNRAPVAVASVSPTSGVVPLTVSFDGSGSTDADGTIVSYTWNFGDGASASGITVSHTYTTPGGYTMGLFCSRIAERAGRRWRSGAFHPLPMRATWNECPLPAGLRNVYALACEGSRGRNRRRAERSGDWSGWDGLHL